MKKFLFLIFYWLLVPLAFAQDAQSTGKGKLGDEGLLFKLENPLKSQSITELLDKIIFTLTYVIAAPIAVLMIIVGAFQMLTAGGEPEKFSNGKKTILFAAIGFAILLIADLLISLVLEILGVNVTKVNPVGPGATF